MDDTTDDPPNSNAFLRGPFAGEREFAALHATPRDDSRVRPRRPGRPSDRDEVPA